MDGKLAAAATLVAHARAWRVGLAPKPHYRKLSAFRYARALRLDMPGGLVIPGRERYKPADVGKWLDWIPRFRASALRLSVAGGVIRDDQVTQRAALATFSPYTFTVVNTKGKGVAWESDREPAPAAKEGALWDVRFRYTKQHDLVPSRSVERATDTLIAAVDAARKLASVESELGQWGAYLDRARATLSSDGVPPRVYDVLPVSGYRPEAQRLAKAVYEAWVLGGIMSWSDFSPSTASATTRHRDVSGELYAALIEGMCAAVNEGLEQGT